jgi:hypothetical protein
MSLGVFQEQGGPEFAINYIDRYTGRRVSARALEKWRETGKGPVYTKIGRSIIYERTDLDQWIASNRRTSTKQYTPPLESGIPATATFSKAVADEAMQRGMHNLPLTKEQIVELLDSAATELRGGADVSPAFDRLAMTITIWLLAFGKAFLPPGESSPAIVVTTQN